MATYTHVTACTRGLRKHRQAQFYGDMAGHELPAKAKGPVATLMQHLKPYGVTLERFVLTDGSIRAHLIGSAW
eukprot:1071922-Amphidinium_carterae.1